MWNRDIGISIIAETIVKEFEKEHLINSGDGFKNPYIELKKRFPNCSDKEIINIIQLACEMYCYKNEEKCELVATVPNNFKVKMRKTKTVITELILNAQRSITLTGYSISDYFSEMIDVIVNKSKQGIYINLYVNDVDKHRNQIDKLLLYAGKYIKIYNYNRQNDDKMAALHAKIIVVDGNKSFISSANLSYHGIQGNIEMGVLLESEMKAKHIEEILKTLKSLKVFKQFDA